MPCYHPNIALCKKHGIIRKDGQIGTKISRIIFANSSDFKGYEFYMKENERFKKSNDEYLKDSEYKMIPCGKCIGCRKQERRNWAIRIELEAKQYENNYFLTLTYNDENINIPERWVNEKTGEIFENTNNWRNWKGTLVKEDTIKFIKSLRKYFEREYNWSGMKFYLCGEYGDQGERPHYHIILMNCPKIELQPIGNNKKTKAIYYTNERIEKIWGKGFINIGPVVWDTISYVAGYCEKKLFGDFKDEYYAQKGQLPVFANMSRRPGIGNAYYQENKEKIYKNDEIINSKGKSVKPPSYFDRKYDIGEHDVMEEIKAKRTKFATNEIKKKLTRTSLTLKEQLKVEENTAIDQQKRYEERRRKEKANIY